MVFLSQQLFFLHAGFTGSGHGTKCHIVVFCTSRCSYKENYSLFGLAIS